MLAPTGVAAINIDGTTIHSGLNIPCHGKLFPLNDKNRALLRNKYSEVQLIIIDEISMVPSKLLFQVHQRLLDIFACSSNIPFAGKPVLVCGDLYQLPPVRAKPIFLFDETQSLMQGVISMDLWNNFKIAELTEVMRQKDDVAFIHLLNKVRVGNVDENVENVLRSRFINKHDPLYPIEALHIFAENSPAKVHNETMLNSLPTALVSIHAEDDIPKNCRNADIIEAQNRRQSETGGLALLLELKVNARVMITSNIDLSDRLINGQVGTVKHFKIKQNKVTTIYLKLDDDKAGLKKIGGTDTIAKASNWVPIKRVETSIYIKKSKSSSSPSIRRTQFPLMLSWACTVHKVQGLSLNEGVISFDLEKQRSFNQGQMYVAISRITNIDKLFLIGEYASNAIKANRDATVEYDRLRQYVFEPCSNITVNNRSLTISLLNTRSLKKHAVDIVKESRLMDSDIICLTETHICINDDLCDIEQILCNFDIHFNTCEQMFLNLAICLGNDVKVVAHEKFPGISMIDVVKPSFSKRIMRLLLLYRSPNSPIPLFYERLRQIVDPELHIDIILGDFNIDAFNECNNTLDGILLDYKLIVNEATNISGSLIDHVYMNKSFLQRITLENVTVTNIHFSDHDAVKFKISVTN